MPKNCHHPQGGFCDNCRAPGLSNSEADKLTAAKLIADSEQRIYEFAAYFVEGSHETRGLVDALKTTLARWVEFDRRQRRRERAGELDGVPE